MKMSRCSLAPLLLLALRNLLYSVFPKGYSTQSAESATVLFHRARNFFAIALSMLMLSACGGGSDCSVKNYNFDNCNNPDSEGEWQEIEYVGKETTTMFDDGSWGEHLYYFPVFNRPAAKKQNGLDTDENGTIEVNRDFEKLVHWDNISKQNPDKLKKRTFSLDDIFDKDEVGTKTAGGYGWPEFSLPADDQGNYLKGQSGVVYDPNTQKNSNNIVNQLKIKTRDLHAFCLNLVTDNTNRRYDPNVEITARGDYDDADATVPFNKLEFDGNPDVYTFKYTGFKAQDKIKIRIRADGSQNNGGGFGGIMVSNIHQCCVQSCGIENECGGDNGCGDPCDCERGEAFASTIEPSVVEDFQDLQNLQGYYIRGLYTRQVLTADINNASLAMRPRRNTDNQQWVFAGSCSSDTECEGYFVNKSSKECLSFDGADAKPVLSPGPCDDEKFKWLLRVEGKDEVIGGRSFEWSNNANKYSIRHKQSTNNYLVARATEKELEIATQTRKQEKGDIDHEKLDIVIKGKDVTVESKEKPNRPWDHWVFEYQNGEAEIAAE